MVQIYKEPVYRFQKKTVREYSRHEMKTNSHTGYHLATYTVFPCTHICLYVVIQWR